MQQSIHWYWSFRLFGIDVGAARHTTSDPDGWERNGKAYKYRPYIHLRDLRLGIVIGWINATTKYDLVIRWRDPRHGCNQETSA